MTTELTTLAESYVRTTNAHDAAGFLALFAEDAVVQDVGREFRGRPAIHDWSRREIFDASVTLEVLDVAQRDGATILTTKVDGNFDRTGLPDPVIITHTVRVEGEKIVALVCQLA